MLKGWFVVVKACDAFMASNVCKRMFVEFFKLHFRYPLWARGLIEEDPNV